MRSESNNKDNGVSKNNSSKFSGIVGFNDASLFVKANGIDKSSVSTAENLPDKKILSNRILGSLPAFDAARLMPHLEFVFLSSGKEIYAAGEFNRYVYFPETAVASDIFDLADGGTIETAIIGSVVAEELVKSGHNVTVFDNLEKVHREAVAPEAEFVEGDLQNGDLLKEVFQQNQIEAVIHLAVYSLVGESVQNPAK
ncbi:MAG: NAD-dependent epimerase/dehydratase family protein [Pyrinomonadaceae bacterium]